MEPAITTACNNIETRVNYLDFICQQLSFLLGEKSPVVKQLLAAIKDIRLDTMQIIEANQKRLGENYRCAEETSLTLLKVALLPCGDANEVEFRPNGGIGETHGT